MEDTKNVQRDHETRLRALEVESTTMRVELRAINTSLGDIKAMVREALALRETVSNHGLEASRLKEDLHSIRSDIAAIKGEMRELRDKVKTWSIPVGIIIIVVTALSVAGLLKGDPEAVKAASSYYEVVAPK
jgi:chromosome segregation ATPase